MDVTGAVVDVTTIGLERALDGTEAQLRSTARNIANADTPGYIPTHVRFEEQLAQALDRARRTQPSGAGNARWQEVLQKVRPLEVQEHVSPLKRDQNAVDIEREITDLARISLHKRALLRLISRKLRMVELAIAQGGGK